MASGERRRCSNVIGQEYTTRNAASYETNLR